MTTDTAPTTPDVASPLRFSAPMTTGICGVAAVVLLGAVSALSPSPDVTGPDAGTRIAQWLAATESHPTVVPTLGIGAVSYALFVVFFAGVHRLVECWDPRGLWRTVTALGSGLFLAGAVVSDALLWSVPLARRTAPDLDVTVGLVAVLDRGWLIALTEAQVALTVVVGATTLAGVAARRAGHAVPRLVLLTGAVGVAGAVPLVLLPHHPVVFLVSNQLRLLWIVVLSCWLLARRPTGSARR